VVQAGHAVIELAVDEAMWRWVNPDNRRYYQADLVQDLLGDWMLVRASLAWPATVAISCMQHSFRPPAGAV
jgi:hypothetical protein